ncbi:MAG: hypothetical protein V2J25_01795 [Desulfatiglans sp.]|jgi:hypothetical protein|nr:hypothetical protein [Thermodesulfobacteriota bacterium]MEE4351581.1 hypothetical protein [Desulfatiglans sp.]
MDLLSGCIEVDMFSEEVDSLDHPEVIHFREVLEEVALDYECRLTDFDIHNGTVSFSFDSDELMASIIDILQNDI